MKAIALLLLLAGSVLAEVPDSVFLLKPVSVVTDDGVSRFEALKFYRVVKEDGGNYVLENDRKAQFVAAKVDVSADAEVIAANAAPSTTSAPAAVVSRVAAPSASDVAFQEDRAQKADLEKRRALLASAENEKRSLEAAKQASIRKGNSRDSIENRARAERIFSLRVAIFDLKTQLGMPAGRRPE